MRLTRWRLNILVKEVLAKAGVGSAGQFGTHSLRKTFAKKIYAATDNDINLTRAVLGHVQVGTTQRRYLEVDDEDVARAILSVGKKPADIAPVTAPVAAGGR